MGFPKTKRLRKCFNLKISSLLLTNLTILLLYSCSESKTTYIVSDITINEDISSVKRDRYLKSALGSEINLEFYDTKLKVSFIEDNEEKTVYILDKVNDNKYKYADSREQFIRDNLYPNNPNAGYYQTQYFDMVLDIDKLFGIYPNSITISMYLDGNLSRKAKAKRKGI